MISDSDVRKIANLARLSLSDEECQRMSSELEQILGYFDRLNSVEVGNVEALSHVHGSTNIFREDVVQTFEHRDAILENAPEKSGTFLRVPLFVGHSEEE